MLSRAGRSRKGSPIPARAVISLPRARTLRAPRSSFSQQATPPGLRFAPSFLPLALQEDLLSRTLSLYAQIERAAPGAATTPARTYLSKQHNLSTDEYYKKLRLEDEDARGALLDAQHFEKYGDDGHTLTYFIGTKNVPSFVRASLIDPLLAVEEVRALLRHKRAADSAAALDWNLTLNVYRTTGARPSVVPGFPFHMDTPSNGEITGIVTLLAAADVEMKPGMEAPAAAYRATLTPGSLFLLSGAARWRWVHRVVPRELPAGAGGAIKRVSLVLGCK